MTEVWIHIETGQIVTARKHYLSPDRYYSICGGDERYEWLRTMPTKDFKRDYEFVGEL